MPAAVSAILDNASSPQPGIAWPREAWISRFPAFEQQLRGLPDLVARDDVRKEAQDAARSPGDAQWAFLVSMIWGYGKTGYGPWRVEQMFSSIEDASGVLLRVVEALRNDGVYEAYMLFGGEARMFKLGPAFGTKFLYFCPPPGTGPAPLILDKLVAQWLQENASLKLNPVPWNTNTYRRYLETMHSWAGSLGVTGEVIEQAVFQAQANSQGGQWASGPEKAL